MITDPITKGLYMYRFVGAIWSIENCKHYFLKKTDTFEAHDVHVLHSLSGQENIKLKQPCQNTRCLCQFYRFSRLHQELCHSAKVNVFPKKLNNAI